MFHRAGASYRARLDLSIAKHWPGACNLPWTKGAARTPEDKGNLCYDHAAACGQLGLAKRS